jgi:hypothetical protein
MSADMKEKELQDLPSGDEKHASQLQETLVTVSRKERLSSAFTIACSGFALISDGLQNVRTAFIFFLGGTR